MSSYNINFLIAALVLLILIFYHFTRQKKLDSDSDRIFKFFITAGIADVSFDIVCTLLMSSGSGELAGISRLCLSAFYMLQVILPAALVYYAQTLRDVPSDKIKRDMRILIIIPAVMMFLVLVNYWGGMMFYFDTRGVYHQGPWYLLMYCYAVLYVIIVGVMTVVYHKQLGTKNIIVLWEYLLIELICTVLQAAFDGLLMIGFGIALGILVLYLTISNPAPYTDQLTGAFNKPYFSKWFKGRRQAGGSHIYVLTVDIFNLKRINKIWGDSTGNRILMRVAEELKPEESDVKVFRITGKSFLIASDTLIDYEKCMENAQQIFEREFNVNDEEIPVSAVICGVTNAEQLDQDALLSYIEYMTTLVADRKETVLIQSSDKIMEGFLYEQEVERFLNTAIEKDLFEINYQPVFSVETGKCISMEALSRLKHPVLGQVPADVFISFAEKNGQIDRIGLLQFRRACRFLSENRKLMEKIDNVKFNLSPLELVKHGHVEKLIDTVREYELPFSFFQFEITETAATEYSVSVSRVIEKFTQAGIGICLDDFGSGYANISTVLKLPFCAVKIDRSMLKGAVGDAEVALFYRSIVNALKEMGYTVISEGVETAAEADMLSSWGVDMMQGYYYSEPVGSDRIAELLEKQ